MAGSSVVLVPILKSAVLPVVVGGGAALLAGRLVKGEQKCDWIPATGLLLGWMVSFFAVAGFTGFPPKSVINWLPFMGLFALPLLWWASKLAAPWRVSLWLVMIAAALFVLLRPRFQVWELQEAIFWPLILAEQWLLVWFLWNRLPGDSEEDRSEIWIYMVMAASAISLVCVFGSAKMAQLFGALGAASGGLFLARFSDPRLRPGSMTMGLLVILCCSFCIQALIYGQINPIAVLLAFSTLLTPLVGMIPQIKVRALWIRISVAVLVNAIPIAIALTYLAKLAAQQDEYDYY